MNHTITECRAEGNYTLWLRFDDGLEGRVYLGDLISTMTYSAISDEASFSRVAIDPVSNAVTWGGGINLDPEFLYRDLANKAAPCTRARRRHRTGRAPSGLAAGHVDRR